MHDHELKEEGPPVKLDNTMALSFEECPRKFYWWRRGFTYAQKPNYFAFGSIWGEMQGLWHGSEGPHVGFDTPEFELSIALCLQLGRKLWTESGAIDDRSNSLSNLEALFLRYVETYQDEPFHLVKGGAEKGWLWPLVDTPYYLGGAIDAYIEWPGYGRLIKEDKTTGIYLNDSYIRQWEFANQVTGYIWYLTQLFGEECWGCLMDMASKRITKTGKTPLFARILIQKSETQLEEFEKDWLYRIHRIEDCWNTWHFPKTMNPINCTGGIGKSPCLYQPLCLSDMPFTDLTPTQFPGIVESDERWAPWEREMREEVKEDLPF